MPHVRIRMNQSSLKLADYSGPAGTLAGVRDFGVGRVVLMTRREGDVQRDASTNRRSRRAPGRARQSEAIEAARSLVACETLAFADGKRTALEVYEGVRGEA